MPPRVRFAPSPTGYLHIGGARTALFNWLLARHHGGTFVLRIEDTDAARSSPEMVDGILRALTWLGLDWDEGPQVGGPHAPYFQRQRLDRHRAAAARLIEQGRAYRCFCSRDDLAARRQAAEAAGGGWIYDRRCVSIPADAATRRAMAGESHVVRLRVPDGRTVFDDMVRGRIDVDHSTIEDVIVLRSDGSPTYHLSVVVDDIDMAITHVVRGDDHVSNTPKHILLFEALGAPRPSFGHVPLILGGDRKRLSKRHGATSVGEYEVQGFLPEAVINFLALLGWSPGDDREVLTRDELVAAFTVDGISGGNAIFDADKLAWFNQQHLGRMSAPDILDRMRRADLLPADREVPDAVIDLVKSRARVLADLPAMVGPFVADRVDRDPAAVSKHLGDPGLAPHLTAWRQAIEALTPFDAVTLESALRRVADERGIKAGTLIHATRVAVTGQAVSPGIFEVLELMERERVVGRLKDVEGLWSHD